MKKVIGYIFGAVGLVIFLGGIKPVDIFVLKLLPFLGNFKSLYLIVGGIVLIIIGIVLLKTSGVKKADEEVPIYRGKNIVGYRRR